MKEKIFLGVTKDGTQRICRSTNYNYNFNIENGELCRWGEKFEDDPDQAPAPEILDIEVTTKCKGVNNKLCSFCYKGNTPDGENMSFETFKTILDKMPPLLTQIAFGADAQCESNPEIWEMMNYARLKKIVPNITVAQISDETADKLSTYCGAVAVSYYGDRNACYESVKKLTDRGMKQINIHVMVSNETKQNVYDVLLDSKNDSRLSKLNSVVLLSLKKKGRGTKFTPMKQNDFSEIIKYCFDNNIAFGMDSCSACKFIEAIKNYPENIQKNAELFTEPCESSLFSSYINTNGMFYPCSFTEGTEGWETGLDVVGCENFIDDIWNHEKTKEFRKKLLDKNRNCPIFEV